jgi:transposase-like protein
VIVSPIATPAQQGWVIVRWKDPQRRLGLRVEEREDGRLRIVELWCADPSGLSGALLRDLPLGAWEAEMNSPAIAGLLREHLHKDPDDYYDLTEMLYDQDSLPGYVDADYQDVDERSLEFRFQSGTSYAVAIAVPPELKLESSSRGKRPDQFYYEVAAAYSWLAGRVRRPAKELATINGVPESTIHRWVKEARRRQLLGPGRRLGATLVETGRIADETHIIYDPNSAEVQRWAERARNGQVTAEDLSSDSILRAWATRMRAGTMSERHFDPIVQAIMQRLDDESLSHEEKYGHLIVDLVLHPESEGQYRMWRTGESHAQSRADDRHPESPDHRQASDAPADEDGDESR